MVIRVFTGRTCDLLVLSCSSCRPQLFTVLHTLSTLFYYIMEQPTALLFANKTAKLSALSRQTDMMPCQSKSEGSQGYKQQSNCRCISL